MHLHQHCVRTAVSIGYEAPEVTSVGDERAHQCNDLLMCPLRSISRRSSGPMASARGVVTSGRRGGMKAISCDVIRHQ